MARRFPGGRLVVASHNPGKVREIRELLAPFGVETVSAAELALAEPEETGATFIANAELKARAAAQASGLPALADDSGVSVADLNGDPGIYSARWAGPGKDFALAMRKVKEALEQTPYGRAEGAKAAFISVLSLAYPDGHCDSFEGIVRGRLVWPPRGERGFGYDPMFVAEGYRDTFGEMSPEEKHAISHRADAFRKLIAACFER